MGRQGLCSAYFLTVDKQADKHNKMSQARAADVEKMKLQMMQAMNIKDPKELQRMAREYCKDMAVELTLPAYHRLATQISRSITKNREVFDALSSTDKVVQLMKAVMEDEEIVEGFKMALDQEDKDATICPELSGDKRSAGNSAFQKKKDEQALNLYSEAAMASLVTTEEGKKDAALAPANILYKVVDRQAKCLAALGRIEEARTSYNRVILLLKQSNLDADKQEAWKKEVDAELQKLKTAKVPEESKKEETSLLTNPNPRIPQFSDAVGLMFSPLVGRHGVATRDIEVGEVLMLDTATTVHLLCGTRLTNCTNCAARVNPITGKPSPVTPTARFCCSACLKTGMESYHPVEAKTNVQKLFWSKKEERFEETSGNILLTLRSVTQKPLQYFLDNKISQRLTKHLVWSSPHLRTKSAFLITRTSPTSKDTETNSQRMRRWGLQSTPSSCWFSSGTAATSVQRRRPTELFCPHKRNRWQP